MFDITSGAIDAFVWVSFNLLFWGSIGFFVYRIIVKKKGVERMTPNQVSNSASQATPTSEITQRPINQAQNTTGFGFSSAIVPQSSSNSVPISAEHKTIIDLVGSSLNPYINISPPEEDAVSTAATTHVEQLERAVSIFRQGLLTEEEFEILKTRILES